MKLKTSEEEETFVRLDRYVTRKEFDELYDILKKWEDNKFDRE